jgi:hypothetical protein
MLVPYHDHCGSVGVPSQATPSLLRPIRVLVRGLVRDVHGTDTLGPSLIPFLYNVHPNLHVTWQVGVLWPVINFELQWTS